MINIFSVPFYQYEVNQWDIHKRDLLDLFQSRELHLEDSVYTDFGADGYSYLLECILSKELDTFKEESGFDCRIEHSWFQKYEPGNFHSIHNHGMHGYSAICFVEYDEDTHKPPTFVCPFHDAVSGNVIEYSPLNIREGSLVVFPSYLSHYVLPTRGDSSRIILSFNLRSI